MDNGQLLALFRERDEKALAEIDRQWGKLCRSLAFNITKNLSDAEECVNDAYRILWEKIPPAAPDPLLPYLLRIVRNRACGVLRYNRCEKRSFGETLAIEELEELLSPAAEPDTEELKDAFRTFLDSLDAKDRALFLGRFWFETPVKTLARKSGLSESNVSARLSRMKSRLGAMLSERGFLLKEKSERKN